jgi:SAM-dependent methyltransferase
MAATDDGDEMPSKAAPHHVPNDVLAMHRQRLASPWRKGQYISRTELADLVNQTLRDLFPGRSLNGLLADSRWIGKLERGDHRWSSPERRAALRHIFGVASDAELGLYIDRPTGEVISDEPHDPMTAGSLTPAATQPRSHAGRSGRQFDPSVMSPARRYNYWLGGKDHFAADRASGDRILTAFPHIPTAVRQNRAFLERTVQLLSGVGVRQFLDLGCGLPLYRNTHDIAQGVDPSARVVYVDHDPLVVATGQALMCSDPRGQISYLNADLRDADDILQNPAITSVFDPQRPIAVLMLAVLHYIPEDEQAITIVKQLTSNLPAGSHLVISHATLDFADAADVDQYDTLVAAGDLDVRARTRDQISALLNGLDLVEPGIISVTDWHPRPAGDERPSAYEAAMYGTVGRVP